MSFRLTILGSSSALPTSERNPSAHAVSLNERIFLVDCGEGTQMQLRRNRIRLGRINHIFLTHLHGDHIFGLYGLLSTLSLSGREEALKIFAPAGFENIIHNHLSDFEIHLNYPLEIVPLVSGAPVIIMENKDMTVTSITLRHRVPCFGFIFRQKMRDRNIKKEFIEKFDIPLASRPLIKRGHDLVLPTGEVIANKTITTDPPYPVSLAVCGDTMYFSDLALYLKDVDLLYLEATFDKSKKKLAKETGHSTSVDAATVARDAGVKRLIIGHFSARYKDVTPLVSQAREIFPATDAAYDGMSVDI